MVREVQVRSRLLRRASPIALAPRANLVMSAAKTDAFRDAFKRAKDGLVELGFIEIEDETVVRLTAKGRNAMHVTAS